MIDVYGHAYPELVQKASHIEGIIREEEELFADVLSKGLKRFEQVVDGKTRGESISGADAFFLSDSLGFPIDLTVAMAEERGLGVDLDGFQAERQAQVSRSRDARRRFGGDDQIVFESQEINELVLKGIQPTDDRYKYEWEEERIPSTRIAAIYRNGNFVDAAEVSADTTAVVLEHTGFYPEGGGQVADTGLLQVGDRTTFRVHDVQSYGGYVVHLGTVESGTIYEGSDTKMLVSYDRRFEIACNHTMTHVLNFALRQVLGPKVDQKGSRVAHDQFRFDFDAPKALTLDQIAKVEAIVQSCIQSALPIYSQVISIQFFSYYR